MQRNGFNYAVETNHGNHPKQCISEIEREVGFYRHDQWGGGVFSVAAGGLWGGGLLALLTRFSIGVFNEGGGLWFRLHLYSTNNKHRSIISTMHKHMS